MDTDDNETTGAADESEWSEAKTDPETGVALDGHDLPINHRLRAEKLADMGKDEDPAGEITPELIADTAERLAAERKARPPIRESMKIADLERIAKREGIDISGATNNAERVSLIETARTGIAAPNEENA